jgi:hypothetical protein
MKNFWSVGIGCIRHKAQSAPYWRLCWIFATIMWNTLRYEYSKTFITTKIQFYAFRASWHGKSTLIRNVVPVDLEIDLLQSKNYLALSSNPSHLQALTKDLKAGSWVFLDEIQKIPSLLDEVHSLLESKKLNFALSGSSARKLRRQGGQSFGW